MQSPFKIFRKYQSVFLATLAVGAIFMFTIGDSLSKMTGRGARSQGAVVVETNVGSLNQSAINELIMNRKVANQFMHRAFVAANPEYERFGMFFPQVGRRFGGETPRDVEYAWLHRHEARKMGIVVDDKQIEAYIDVQTNKKLSSAQFREILKQLGLNNKQLYDVLREELLSLLVFQLTSPADPLSPEQYWKMYQQLNTRQKTEVVALPIKDFAAKVPAPTDAEIATFFESHKDEFERAFDGEFNPGFRQDRKVKLHTLRLAYLDVESDVIKSKPVTDDEVAEYYEQKKDIDRSLQDFDVTVPDDSKPIDPKFAPDEELDQPANPPTDDESAEKPDADSEKPSEEGPQDESKSKRAPESKPEDDTGSPKSVDPCGLTEDDPNEKSEKPVDDRKPDDKQTGNDKPEKEQQTTDEEPAKGEASKADESPADGEPDEESTTKPNPPKSKRPTAEKKPAAPPAPKYRVLDDELRGEIKDRLIRERTKSAMQERTRRIEDKLRDLGLKLITGLKKQPPAEDELARLADESRAGMKRIADEFDLTFEETKLVSPRELSEIPGLGKAEESMGDKQFGSGTTTLVEQAFTVEALCRVLTAEGPGPDSSKASVDAYIYWKVAETPVHVGTLLEPGVREEVIEAWKRQEALPIAKKRATEIADRVRASTLSIEAALEGQTITGDPNGLAVAVRQSVEFTWWREASVPNAQFGGSRPTIQLGNPIVVTNAGYKFMEFVFNQLQEGDVGTVVNDDASIYYVVKIVSRRPATREGFQNAVLFGGNTPYEQLAAREQQIAKAEFDRRLENKYAVKRHENASDNDSGPSDDE